MHDTEGTNLGLAIKTTYQQTNNNIDHKNYYDNDDYNNNHAS